jgi:hypothetical protein
MAELGITADSDISYLLVLHDNWPNNQPVLVYDLLMGLHARECALREHSALDCPWEFGIQTLP